MQNSERRIQKRPIVYACEWTSLVHSSQVKKRFFKIVGAGSRPYMVARTVVASVWPLYDPGIEAFMIELTEQQIEAVATGAAMPPRVVNPRTKETFVLFPIDEYQRLKEGEYDDSPWTREELQAVAWEAGKRAGWEQMDEYDDLPEKP